MSYARFAPVTASLLARKGSAMPSSMVPHHPVPVFVENVRPLPPVPAVAVIPAAPAVENEHDGSLPHDPSRSKKLFISLSHREHERLAIASVKTGLDRHQLVRDALEAYFEQLSRDMHEGCACMSGLTNCGGCCGA